MEAYLDFVTRVHQDTDGAIEIVEIHDVLGSDDHAVLLVKERFSREGQVIETDQYAYDELFPA